MRTNCINRIINSLRANLLVTGFHCPDHYHAAVAEIGAIAVLNDIHADAAMSLESGYEVLDTFFRVDEHNWGIINALLRWEIELSIHFPGREFDI